MMRICYLISNVNTKNKGNGGHYYSLISTALAMQEVLDITILNIGTHESLALANSNLKICNVITNKRCIVGIWDLIKKANGFFTKEKYDVIHAFDDSAYFFGRLSSRKLKAPIVLTKCGGPNPKFYYPYSKDLILYSEENFKYFRGYRKFKKSNIDLIPNRIYDVKQDNERIKLLIEKYNLKAYDFILLRIARIGNAYQSSINQLIEVKRHLDKSVSSAVLIIGSVENNEILNTITKQNIQDLFIETDPFFTKKASELIQLADIVLGTGRSFMEASVLGKLMLAPTSNSDFPLIVDNDNFQLFSAFNFSPRTKVNSFTKEEEINKLNSLLIDKEKFKLFVEDGEQLFKSKFQLKFVLGKYSSIYKNLTFKADYNIIDLFLNFIFLLRLMAKKNK